MKFSEILEFLKTNSELKYKEFQSRIIPTKMEILGARMGKIRSLATKILKSLKSSEILDILSMKSKIYEISMLQGILLSEWNFEFSKKLEIYESFISLADNWALIDGVKFRNLSEFDKILLFKQLKIWLKNEDEFIKRAGFVNLTYHFVEDEYLDFIFSIPEISNYYYDRMAHAWLLSECMAKFPQNSLKFFSSNPLSKKTHNLAIQKSLESRRVVEKELLKSLKR